ncbi:MAG: exodeoxyribonuclease VII large subunit [Ignavibacteriales bacterium]|nr:exodeoxyribonuclease VII large subunit [Ignavibacteriales bacterium]
METVSGVGRKILTVSEITRKLRIYLEETFPQVWVQGEISNCKRHGSGHFYFTLKDEMSQISAVMWQSNAEMLLFALEDGMKVVVRGAITVYPPKGNYQIDVDKIQPLGIGDLQMAFERLKQKLAAEGLFDARRKRPIPEFPRSIGIITSESGAALQDIRSVLLRRFSSVEVIFAAVKVQGPGAAEEIAGAIADMNRYGKVDVIIVGRGGGSLEDLWAFNEEVVARAIYHSKIPVVSAVGHEIDFSISDFVADVRAATPSAAAELVVRDRGDLLDILRNMCYTMRNQLEETTQGLRTRIESLVASYAFNRPKDIIRESAQTVDEFERSLNLKFRHLYQLAHQHQRTIRLRLDNLDPAGVLKRGYTMVRKEGQVVTSSRSLLAGDRATIRFHDGEVSTRVEE